MGEGEVIRPASCQNTEYGTRAEGAEIPYGEDRETHTHKNEQQRMKHTHNHTKIMHYAEYKGHILHCMQKNI